MSDLLKQSKAVVDLHFGGAARSEFGLAMLKLRVAVTTAIAADPVADLMNRIGPVCLTPRQQEVLIEIDRFWRENNVAPSLSELAALLKCSKVNCFEHVTTLKKKGVVTWTRNMSRTLRIVSAEENRNFDAMEAACEN